MIPSKIYYRGAVSLLIIVPFLFVNVCGMNLKQVISSVAFAVVYGGMMASSASSKKEK